MVGDGGACTPQMAFHIGSGLEIISVDLSNK